MPILSIIMNGNIQVSSVEKKDRQRLPTYSKQAQRDHISYQVMKKSPWKRNTMLKILAHLPINPYPIHQSKLFKANQMKNKLFRHRPLNNRRTKMKHFCHKFKKFLTNGPKVVMSKIPLTQPLYCLLQKQSFTYCSCMK